MGPQAAEEEFGEEERSKQKHDYNPAPKSAAAMEGLESNRRVLLVSDGSAGYAKEFFGGKIKSVLFIPWARADWDSYEDIAKSILRWNVDEDLEVVSIHRFADPIAAVKEAEAFYVGGGNTFRLLKNIYETGIMPAIREKVAQGTPYVGTRYNPFYHSLMRNNLSAGANVATASIHTTNDMPIGTSHYYYYQPHSLG